LQQVHGASLPAIPQHNGIMPVQQVANILPENMIPSVGTDVYNQMNQNQIVQSQGGMNQPYLSGLPTLSSQGKRNLSKFPLNHIFR